MSLPANYILYRAINSTLYTVPFNKTTGCLKSKGSAGACLIIFPVSGIDICKALDSWGLSFVHYFSTIRLNNRWLAAYSHCSLALKEMFMSQPKRNP